MHLSFSGCGFLCIYHVGVASCFKQYAPHILDDKIAGASGGSLSATALLCSVPLGESTSDVLRIATEARSRTLGPFHPGFDLNKILHEGLVRLLPDDAHLQCNGRLHISVTRCSDGKNFLLSQFNSREELIQALLCSCFIPFYSGIIPPKYRGVYYIDGGFSDNLPVLDENTITVSPFAGESDICPEDNSLNYMQFYMSKTSIAVSAGNLYRLVSTLYPPHPEVLSQICQQGFDDALKFLQRNNVISCTRCLAVQSSFGISERGTRTETTELNYHPYDNCAECRHKRQMALLDSLPESVVEAFENMLEKMNKGIINWLFRHQPIKILPFMFLPYVLPFDITVVAVCKIWETLPYIQKEMKSCLSAFASLAVSLLNKFDKKRHQYSAKFSCQLAITEFDYAQKEKLSTSVTDSLFESVEAEDRITPTRKMHNKYQMQKRMSYAGWDNVPYFEPVRRKSVGETVLPHRVIKNLKLGFTVDMAESNANNQKENVVNALKSLQNNSEANPFDIANKMLDWKKDYIEYIEPHNADKFGEVLEVANTNEAVMAFYYKDDKNVKVTEIFNISDENSSIIMTDEEKELNTNLQWDNDYDVHSFTSEQNDDNDLDSQSEYSECMDTVLDLETVDSYSLDVHGTELRRARKKSVTQTPFNFVRT